MLNRLKMVWRWYSRPSTLAVDFHTYSRNGLDGSQLRRFRRTLEYKLLFPVVEAWSGVTLPREVKVGDDLRIYHRGKVVINERTVIGNSCRIVHGVTLGNRVPGGGAPVLGDRVSVGSYAQILGEVHIGDDAKIGSMALVVEDVPAGATVFAARGLVRSSADQSKGAT